MAKQTKKSKASGLDVEALDDVPGLGPVTIGKLNEAGIYTKRDIVVRTFIDIADITGMKREDSEKVKIYCRKRLIDAGHLWPMEQTASELLERRKTVEYVKSGSEALDNLLQGGFECMAINEISGAFRSGKTQMGICLSVQSLLPKSKGGLSPDDGPPSMVLYIDTEGTCRPERMKQVILGKGYAKTEEEANTMLGRIIVQKPHDAPHLLLMLQYGAKVIRELNIRMIVVDSATMFYRQEMAEMGDAGRKFRLLNEMNGLLRNMAEHYNICVIYINQVYQSTDPYNPGQKIYGGNVVGHAMTYRLALRKKSKTWVATTLDYPHIDEEDVEFIIDESGIHDVKKKKKGEEE